MNALLLVYAVGVLGTALAFCRDEDRSFGYRVEAMLLWPLGLAARLFI